MHKVSLPGRACDSSVTCELAFPRVSHASRRHVERLGLLAVVSVLLSACTPAPRATPFAEKAPVPARAVAAAPVRGTSSMPATGPAKQEMPGRFAEDILAAHNRKRCQHGVPPLQWHPGVAAYAQNWVDRGGFAHSQSYDASIGPLGENLYGATGTVPTGTDAVEAWYGEVALYKAGSGFSASTGHYTAMIWKDAKYLGCGQSGGRIFCNYWSGGQALNCSVPNMQGCEREQVLPRLPAARSAICRGQS